jgi:N-acetylornithine carbamoyltransferase
MRRFNHLGDFSREEIKDLIALAARLDEHPEPRALAGKVLSLLFLSPSLRTLSSFQAAMIRLGGGAFVISPEMSIHGLESRYGVVMDGDAAEHVREAIPVIASYGDAMGVRAFAGRQSLDHDVSDKDFQALTSLIDKPWINMESAIDHPCQSLADWKTMDELGIPANQGKFVLSWAYHPKALPLAVPAATLHMAAMRGMDVVVLRPDGFALPAPIMEKAAAAAAAAGGTLRETSDRDDAMNGAHVIYAKEWGSTSNYGNAEADARQRAALADWCVRDTWFSRAAVDCKLMHCLPVRRNVAVADEVLDSRRSVVQREAYNRLVVQTAVLHRLLASPQH